ncbi:MULTISPECIES: hypothetical protein [Streptomyces]|uniref:Uncharacterized protein n=1 Tax=Streptomyces pratisoli TaxID=3139917 RepID=A0ACC6QJK2_9ACTN|nr:MULTISPECIES: hypothetical protein [unclassified Streptomyces]MCX4512134.1 hypothetical protein [Streptomyces sp. NBC_01619]
MKPMKVAAVVAGSLVAAGASAPAFAASELTPTSLNGAVGTVASQTTSAVEPITNRTLDTEQKGSLLNSVQGATNDINKQGKGGAGQLLGGLPLGS